MVRVFDPYLIPGTNVLRNLVGATDEDALAAAENDLCSARAAILRENLPPAEGTLEQLRRIHRFLFRDVYDWAGEVRTIDMGKGEGLPFQPLELFSIGVRYSEEVLRADDLLKGLGHDEFVKRLSVSYNNFNILHPFREGNGDATHFLGDHRARGRLAFRLGTHRQKDERSSLDRGDAAKRPASSRGYVQKNSKGAVRTVDHVE